MKQPLNIVLAAACVLPLAAFAQTAVLANPEPAARNVVKTIDFTKDSDVALFAQVIAPQDSREGEAAQLNIVKVIDFTQQDPFAAVDFSGKSVNQGAAKAAAEQREAAVAQSSAIAKSVSYTVRGKTYRTLSSAENFSEEGSASWYGPGFHGRKTASGEVFNMNELTAAHKHLPLGSRVKVTNLHNGKSVIVRINDRGPFHGNRVIDLSKAAARELGVLQAGTAKVSIVSYK